MRMSDVLRQLRQEQHAIRQRPRLLHRYEAFLPVTDATPPLSLGEGFTPLIHARTLGRAIGCPQLFLKFEGANPTGSFKDRGMVLAVAKAMEQALAAIICASTGNTSASAAAYGAAAGMEVIVVLPAGRIAAGKLLQAQAAGARVIASTATSTMRCASSASSWTRRTIATR
jgi:threonine synthase